MTPVIRIDDQVMDALNKRAIHLGNAFVTPNDLLRIVLGLDSKDFVEEVVGKAIEIKLNASSPEYVLIPLPKDKRYFFPGFKENFELITDAGVLRAHVTSGPKGTLVGDPNAGVQIRGGLGQWYAKHKELKAGDRLRIEALE